MQGLCYPFEAYMANAKRKHQDRGTVMRLIEGKGREVDRGGALMEAILQAIDEHAEGMTVIAVLGCLELAKIAVLDKHESEA
jgi:hypothetical protein